MLEEWGRYIVWALGACTGLIAIAEFYGGKELRDWVKARLEDWWLRLSYLRIPNVGLAEAKFASASIQKLFGKTLSVRRAAVCVLIVLLCLDRPSLVLDCQRRLNSDPPSCSFVGVNLTHLGPV
jgi:hypothetical protein